MIQFWESNGKQLCVMDADNVTQEELDAVEWDSVKIGDYIFYPSGAYMATVNHINEHYITLLWEEKTQLKFDDMEKQTDS